MNKLIDWKNRLKKGYIRVGKHTPDKPQKYIIQFLMLGTIKDIENGNIVLTGKNSDGSVQGYYKIVQKALPTTSWSYDSHDARDYGTKILKHVMIIRKN